MILLALLLLYPGAQGKQDVFLGENVEYGYVKIDETPKDNSIFYWLFKSRTGLPSSSLIVWLEGGPGCSAVDSLFLQNGPYRATPNSTVYFSNPYSWTNLADVLYSDQPMGTGLSYCSNVSRIPKDGEGMAKDFYRFFKGFLEKHGEYGKKNTTVYFAGHSYVGHYIPAIIKLLIDKRFDYKIGGVMLGNLYTDGHSLAWSYPTFAYNNKLIGDGIYFLGRMAQYLFEIFNFVGMENAAITFYELARKIPAGYITPYFNQGHIGRKKHIPDKVEHIVRKIIFPAMKGVDTSRWIRCNRVISGQVTRLDHMRDYTSYLDVILNSGIPLMVYYGDKDYACNTDSWEHMSRKLKWPDAKEFLAKKSRNLWVEGENKAEYKQHKNLWYFKVYDAGHIVLTDKPEVGFTIMSMLMNLFNH
eukprot:TRINITY_DN6479_c0_g3_i2.p1 TRINITY_DN6479_c0_g3~~TRINITY_DN6479_c0_g3_i2.p1  ORF type:complete len:415 (-),score=98.40 TRINITY_DN6479_c0_g3_i2:148-1392(-)